jgi:hypothetical protein
VGWGKKISKQGKKRNGKRESRNEGDRATRESGNKRLADSPTGEPRLTERPTAELSPINHSRKNGSEGIVTGDRILRIRGQRWRLRFVPNLGNAEGVCDKEQRTIRIALGYPEDQTLDSIVHEVLHAALWDLDEEAVHETANAISSALWKLQYRRSR